MRSKVAVASRQEGLDPVGACVGMRGIRIQNIVNELYGEKIDIVAWHPDMSVFIANALSPAQVVSVELLDTEKTAQVIVPERQLSLAIGKEGQNARLAAKLTGWRIDIKSATATMHEPEEDLARRAVEALRAEAGSGFDSLAALPGRRAGARRTSGARCGPITPWSTRTACSGRCRSTCRRDGPSAADRRRAASPDADAHHRHVSAGASAGRGRRARRSPRTTWNRRPTPHRARRNHGKLGVRTGRAVARRRSSHASGKRFNSESESEHPPAQACAATHLRRLPDCELKAWHGADRAHARPGRSRSIRPASDQGAAPISAAHVSAGPRRCTRSR